MSEVKRFKPVINNKPYRPYAYCEENSEGIYVRIDDYDALKAERDALAADNVVLKNFIAADFTNTSSPNIAFTDAILNSVRAEAVQSLWNDSLSDVGHVLEEIGAYQDASEAAGIVHDEIKERVEDFAAQLRNGKDGE